MGRNAHAWRTRRCAKAIHELLRTQNARLKMKTIRARHTSNEISAAQRVRCLLLHVTRTRHLRCVGITSFSLLNSEKLKYCMLCIKCARHVSISRAHIHVCINILVATHRLCCHSENVETKNYALEMSETVAATACAENNKSARRAFVFNLSLNHKGENNLFRNRNEN